MSIGNNSRRMRNVVGVVLFPIFVTAGFVVVGEIQPLIHKPMRQPSFDSRTHSYSVDPKALTKLKILYPAQVITGAWKHDGKAKIVVRYQVDENSYPENIPNLLDLSVILRRPLRYKWVIWSMDLLEQSPGCNLPKCIIITQSVKSTKMKAPFERRESFSGFRKAHCTYLVEVRLHHTYGDLVKNEVEYCKEAIVNGGGLLVIDELGTAELK